MRDFDYRNRELYCEGVSLARLAENVGTPCYVYSTSALLRAYSELDEAFASVDHLICFAIKSNSNLAVLKLLAAQGAGMDIVSGGELYRALQAGVPSDRIIYSGVGKSEAEIRYALASGILCFNVESLPELEAIERVASSGDRPAPVSLRINPDVESRTHEYTSTGKKENKFGIPYSQALDFYKELGKFRHLKVLGIDTHIGSQVTEIEPFVQAFRKLAGLFERLREAGTALQFMDIGGGLGITYRDETPPTAAEFAQAVLPIIKPLGCRIILEPGRFISGNAGVLLTRVLYFKQTGVKNFAIIDAGINDLIRPSLYNAYHEILPVKENDGKRLKMDVVGPICETGDWLAKDRELPELEEGDLLVFISAGAYSATMSSNYNSRPRGAEVLVEGSSYRVVRRAESYADLVRGEEV
ncbi:MAG TPA: diaminopimelate decarboxylase [archaeon]|nr:diaminopimelate decarboxylase [archaeon]